MKRKASDLTPEEAVVAGDFSPTSMDNVFRVGSVLVDAIRAGTL